MFMLLLAVYYLIVIYELILMLYELFISYAKL